MASKSTPDFWGIGQLLPNVPRLDQRPGVRGILSDLTCDSDGKINKFISGESSWPLHELEEGGGISGGGRYYLGMFLGGAYEEALGGAHNLFGCPSVVRVLQSDGPHSFAVTRAVPGPSCGDVLRVMQHEPELMFETLKHRADEFVHDDGGSFAYASLASGLAGPFHNMPYLVAGSSCGYTAANGGNPYYYCSDENYGAVGDSAAAGEDEQWTYCCA